MPSVEDRPIPLGFFAALLVFFEAVDKDVRPDETVSDQRCQDFDALAFDDSYLRSMYSMR